MRYLGGLSPFSPISISNSFGASGDALSVLPGDVRGNRLQPRRVVTRQARGRPRPVRST
jgi:hypothetical protein